MAIATINPATGELLTTFEALILSNNAQQARQQELAPE